MVVACGVAEFHTATRTDCHAGFDSHYSLHLACCIFIAVAHEAEHIDDVLAVCITNLLHGWVVLHIVVFVAQCESTLTYFHHVFCAVHHVGTDATTDDVASASELLCVHEADDGVTSFEVGYSLQVGQDWCHAVFVLTG